METTPKKVRTERDFVLTVEGWGAAEVSPRLAELQTQIVEAQTFVHEISVDKNAIAISLSTPAIATVADCIAQYMSDHPGNLTITSEGRVVTQDIAGDDPLELIEVISLLS